VICPQAWAEYATDLVRFIREISGNTFFIEVAAYPECHPQSLHSQEDLLHFKEKIEAGANSALTQYFYTADAYWRFVEDVRAMGVTVPIIPGIMPITNYTQLARFSDACGAEIPRWIRQHLMSCGDDKEAMVAFGVEVISDLCRRLLDQGAPGLHFYTLNQSTATVDILGKIGCS